MGVRSISTHDAVVKTATVEVKVLSLSGKQVTLAVFRQLKLESILDESGKIVGVPWGTVNYCTKDCPDNRHFHVVWQKGLELRRDAVLVDATDDDGTQTLVQRVYRRAAALFLKSAVEGVFLDSFSVGPISDIYPASYTIRGRTFRVRRYGLSAACRLYLERDETHHRPNRVSAAKKEFEDNYGADFGGKSLAEIETEALESGEAYLAYVVQYKHAVSLLQELDQLFIAV